MTPRSGGLPGVDLDQIVEAAPAAIFVKDAGGTYIYVNRQHEVITGFSSAETLGVTDFDLYPSDLATVYRDEDLQTLEQMAPVRFEQPAFLRGSERFFAVVKFPVLDGDDPVAVCGIAVDITPNEDHDASLSVLHAKRKADAFFGRLLASLTPQEVRVLDLVATGLSDREIAEKLSLSSDTVRHHVSHLLRKLRKRRGQVIIEMLKRDRS